MSNLPAHILAILNGSVTAINATVTDTAKPHTVKAKEPSDEPAHTVGVLTELPEIETHSIEGANQIWED